MRGWISRCALAMAAIAHNAGNASTLLAQELANEGDVPPAAPILDLTVHKPGCVRDPATASTDAIVVCAGPVDQDRYRLYDLDEATDRMAERTARSGDPRAPDLRPPPCVPSLMSMCMGMGKSLPAAVLIDFDALPDAPPGSDADRIAQGVAPGR